MARQKLPMRHIQEILRLKHQNQLSLRDIARSCDLAVSTIGDYLKRAEAASLGWPLPEGMTEEELTQKLFGGAPEAPPQTQPLPDWATIHQELRRKGVTLQLLWQEYRQIYPEGYGYSRFCELYQAWAGTLCPVLRQVHLAGEKMFVDWAGQTVPIYGQEGTESAAQVFVAVLGFSNKTFAEAFPNQQLASWVAAHCHAYAFFSGVARVTVPDYVARHIIRIMFPPPICAAPVRRRENTVKECVPWSHNVQRALSHFISSASSRQMGFRRHASEEAEVGGWHACNAASFIRRLISA